MHDHTRDRVPQRILALLLAAAVILGLTLLSSATESELTSPLRADQCAVYNYGRLRVTSGTTVDQYAPTLYVWDLNGSSTIRVYDVSGNLLGKSRLQSDACLVPLNGLGKWGGVVYVTRQEDGKAESLRTEVRYSDRADPSISLRVRKVSATARLDSEEDQNVITKPSGLQVGSYYVAEVLLQNFSYVQTVTMPIRYDTSVLQLVQTKYSAASGGYSIGTGTAVSAGGTGKYIPSFIPPLNASGVYDRYAMGGNNSYGVGVYKSYMAWGAYQNTAITSSVTETPYVNTDSGIVKLEFSTESAMPEQIGAYTKLARLYFKCIGTPDDTASNWTSAQTLHFATEAGDLPKYTRDSEKKYYYCAISPYGARATLRGFDLLSPPLSAEEATYSTTSLTTTQLYTLPMSLASSSQNILANQIKVYNYANSSPNMIDYGRVDDQLLLTPSKMAAGGARAGDIIKAYGNNNNVIARGTVSSDGGLALSFMNNNCLSRDGGEINVTVTRSNGQESSKIPIAYPAEVERNVYFKVYSTGYTGADGAQLLGSNLQAKRGDQIRLELYFDDFEDLVGYTFALHFNPESVQPANQTFDKLQSGGYVDQQSFENGTSCFTAGSALTGVNFLTYVLYDYWYELNNDYDLTEEREEELNELIDSAMAALGINEDQLEPLMRTVETTGNWQGGLVFTREARQEGELGSADPGRTEDTLYPYVDMENGMIKLSAASTISASLHSEDGKGYHFLSIYFVGVSSEETDPEFRLCKTSDAAYDKANTSGGTVLTSGPVDGSETTGQPGPVSLSYSPSWQAYKISEEDKIPKSAQLLLEPGNGRSGDGYYDVYVYSNGDGTSTPYYDPGFKVKDEIGEIVGYDKLTGIKWKSTDGAGTTKQLSPWKYAQEMVLDGTLNPFVIPANSPDQYSADFTVTYTCKTQSGVELSDTRTVHVIYRRGDVNRDGKVDVFDEQALSDHLYGYGNLRDALRDALFESKTADVDRDGYVDEYDRDALTDNNLGLVPIVQEYMRLS